MNEIKNQPEALRLAELFRLSGVLPGSVSYYAASELRRLHSENQDLRARVQELGEMARENRSRRVIELERRIAEMEEQMAAIGAGGVEPLRSPKASVKHSDAIVFANDRPDSGGERLMEWSIDAEELICSQHAMIVELNDHLAAIGAGGVEPLRKRGATAYPTEGVPTHETCETCQGNGEIVKDWDRYNHPHVGDKGDEAVSPCPDCEGTGEIPRAHPAEGVPAQKVQVEVDLPDVEDMAHSALQEALSFGFSHDVLHRWMRKVMMQTQEAIAATNPIQQGLAQFIEQVGDVHFQRCRIGSKDGAIRWDIELGYYNGVRGKTLREAITKAIAAQAKRGGAA